MVTIGGIFDFLMLVGTIVSHKTRFLTILKVNTRSHTHIEYIKLVKNYIKIK